MFIFFYFLYEVMQADLHTVTVSFGKDYFRQLQVHYS